MPFTGSRPSALALIGLLATMNACGDDGPVERPPIAWEGQHVRVGTEAELNTWCPGSLTRLDNYIGSLKELFDVPEDHVVPYYVYSTQSAVHEACLRPVRACVRAGDVLTGELLDIHEAAHAVSWAFDYLPPFFEEGAASYWGRTSSVDFQGLELRDVLERLWAGGLGFHEYALAAHFTSFIIHTYGMEPYALLLRNSFWDQTREEFEAAFMSAFGFSLDDAIDAYESEWPYCNTTAIQRLIYECAQPAATIPPGASVQFDLDISCADPDVVGPSSLLFDDRVSRIWKDLTIDIERSEHSVSFALPALEEPNSVLIQIKRCDTECGAVMFNTRHLRPGGGENGEAQGFFSFSLLPGRYVVRVSRAADDPGPVRFTWRSSG